MLRDRGTTYNLGFGIPPTRMPDDPDVDPGPDPRGGWISKKLNGHPFMRFVGTTVATMAGAAVAQKMLRGGGVRLLRTMDQRATQALSASEHVGSLRRWETNLLTDFKKIRSTLDAWEGVERIDPDDFLSETKTLNGWWASQAAKERRYRAARLGIEAAESVEEWTWRNDVQQAFVRQARRLPYELPAIYLTQRVATDRIFGGEKKDRGKWYNPVDVVGDFANESAKNLMQMLLPIEAGGTALKAGYRDLMTYGDFASSTAAFSPHIRKFSIGLQTLLNQVGHDASTMLANTVSKSRKVTGSFGTAIQEYADTPSRFRQPKSWVAKPRSFYHGFRDTWRGQTLYDANLAAIRRGDTHFLWHGAQREVSTLLVEEGGFSELEQIASSVKNFAEKGSRTPGFMRAGFARMRLVQTYEEKLAYELVRRGVPEEAAREFVGRATITNLPSGEIPKSISEFNIAERLRLGDRANDAHPHLRPGETVSEWSTSTEAQLRGLRHGAGPFRGQRVFDDEVAARISRELPSAALRADRAFTLGVRPITNRINQEWDEIYRKTIVPYAKERLEETILPYSMFDREVTAEAREILVRKTAQHLGMETVGVPYEELREAIRTRGFNVEDIFDMRNFLIEEGVISKPWAAGGHNIFGLRKLTAQEALDQNYFRPGIRSAVRRLLGDVSATDPEIGGSLHRAVGKGVYQTIDGQIIDLSRLINTPRAIYEKIHQHFQIPFLHIRPVSLLGGNEVLKTSKLSPIQIMSGRGQRFLGEQAPDDSIAVWLREKKGFILTGPKGRAVIHRLGDDVRDLGSGFRSLSTSADSIRGRALRFAIGDKGQAMPMAPGDPEPSRTRKFLNIDPDQQHSLFRFFSRIKNRKGDLYNPAELMEWIQSGDFDGTFDVTSARGFRRFEEELRKFGLTADMAKRMESGLVTKISEQIDSSVRLGAPQAEIDVLEAKLARYKTLFSVADPAIVEGGVPAVRSLATIRNPDEMFRVLTNMLDEDSQRIEALREAGNHELANQLSHSQSILRKVYLPHENDRAFLTQSAAQSMRSTGVFTKLDELRSDMYRYLVAREGILEAGAGGGPHQVVHDLLDEVDSLVAQKQIQAGEIAEARAAILGMHVNALGLHGYNPKASDAQNMANVAMSLKLGRPSVQSAMGEIRNYNTNVIHQNWLRRNITRHWLSGAGPRLPNGRQLWSGAGRADYRFEGLEYNPFGGGVDSQIVPTFGTAFRRHPFRALRSVLGSKTWDDPDAFSGAGALSSHFYQRLNRYFSVFGLGTSETGQFTGSTGNESYYGGPLDFFHRGLVGRRVLPTVVAGTTLMAADRTLGGYTNEKDEYGERQYRPVVTGAIATGLAHGSVAAAAILPGGDTAAEQREQVFGDQDVAIRKGRWWPLGNQPWRGGRVQYYRPSWYKRFMSGYQYTDQGWSSPAEKAAFGYDWSPLRPFDPNRWEREHYTDRPYPVTGDYFTGPWGPLTSILNLTVGRFLKPSAKMHEAEFNQAMSNYQRVGEYALAPPPPDRGVAAPVAARYPTGSSGIFRARHAAEVLHMTGHGQAALAVPANGESAPYARPYSQPYGFMGVPYGTNPNVAAAAYRQERPIQLPPSYAMGGRSALGVAESRDMVRHHRHGRSVHRAQQQINAVNQGYMESAAAGPPRRQQYDPYNRTVMLPTRSFDPRVTRAANPVDPNSLRYQASRLGYENQELFGIYGFLFGSAREAWGFGSQDLTPQRPVMQQAGRGYGMERSFWDLNLGGLGDLPNASEGEYGNLEISEIVRRFIPHRRRDESEINPLTNDMGRMYPWLPADDYFLNFHQGDPYTLIPEGEMRLPGPGYERTHQLHSDFTGKYGLVDQHAILGDVAPWSQQYKAIDRILKKSNLSPEQLAMVRETRKQVAAVNKRHEFRPYKYANTKFTQLDTKVVSYKPGDADTLMTTAGPIRFAGTRIKGSRAAREWLQSQLAPGDNITVTYDAWRPPQRDNPVDVVVEKGGKNINRMIRESEYFREARTSAPIDSLVREGRFEYMRHRITEELGHRNSILNTKFAPNRTAVEDWERTNVYGSNFPQWQHPIRDFLKPIAYRAMNRNPIVSAVVLGLAGRMFFTDPVAQAFGTTFGAALGFTLGMKSDIEAVESGKRFVPLNRKKEMAVEEYTDILSYVKWGRLYQQEREAAIREEGNDPEEMSRMIERGKYKKFQMTNLGTHTANALAYRRSMRQTMYGADVYGDVMDLSAAIPKRKRDHFLEFLNAPINERSRILSTAPRLERRIYEARWGMKVERRPDLDSYFAEHELPDQDWEGWDPNVNMDTIKLKIAASQGIDVSQMGYFPQQRQEADLINPSYPDFDQRSDHREARNRLKNLLRRRGVHGDVVAVPSGVPGSRVELSASVDR